MRVLKTEGLSHAWEELSQQHGQAGHPAHGEVVGKLEEIDAGGHQGGAQGKEQEFLKVPLGQLFHIDQLLSPTHRWARMADQTS